MLLPSLNLLDWLELLVLAPMCIAIVSPFSVATILAAVAGLFRHLPVPSLFNLLMLHYFQAFGINWCLLGLFVVTKLHQKQPLWLMQFETAMLILLLMSASVVLFYSQRKLFPGPAHAISILYGFENNPADRLNLYWSAGGTIFVCVRRLIDLALNLQGIK